MQEYSEPSTLLKDFGKKVIFKTPFLRSLMSLILSNFVKPSFVERKFLSKNQSLITYSNCSQTFGERENFCEKDTGKFLAKMSLRVSNINSYEFKIRRSY